MTKMGWRQPIYVRRARVCRGLKMGVYEIIFIKTTLFFGNMTRFGAPKMPNLLSELVFSSYTTKMPLNSDVQPVQVVGPSLLRKI
jgi:hypothetical protein